MPFDPNAATEPRNIAVIGAGISGLGAAHLLAGDHRVTLFEAEPRLGGHARTIVAGKRGDQPVDTGFIVFNKANYPNLLRLFDELDVPVAESDMSFSAQLRGGALEYGLRDFSALFAQKRNAFDPGFLGMIRDVVRFNAKAAETCDDPTEPLSDFLDRLGMGRRFREDYLLPLSAAIWSTPKRKILDFPAQALIRFFDNHALLHHSGQHQWYTVQGGSVEYVSRLERSLKSRDVTLNTGCPVDAIQRVGGKVQIKVQSSDWQTFDAVIMATHSDDTLRMLSDVSPLEHKALGAVRYQPNRVVLHSDESVMPTRRACWASWNYRETEEGAQGPVDLSYWMNCLQPIPKDDPLFVTLNAAEPIREELIHDETVLRHPIYDLEALEGQRLTATINGQNNTWFCGAWMRNGFHEDGLASAVEAVEGLRAKLTLGQAA